MKQIKLITMLLLTTLFLGITSCSDDDDFGIVGKWKNVIQQDDIQFIEFKSNGDILHYYSDVDYSIKGQYRIEGSDIYIRDRTYDPRREEVVWSEWYMSQINLLNSTTLILQEYSYTGKLLDRYIKYDRVK